MNIKEELEEWKVWFKNVTFTEWFILLCIFAIIGFFVNRTLDNNVGCIKANESRHTIQFYTDSKSGVSCPYSQIQYLYKCKNRNDFWM